MPRERPQPSAIQSDNASVHSTPGLEKGLDILELLSRESTGLTKTQIARELGRTVSEIFRMLLCLERRGYIVAGSLERYSLTLKPFRIAHQHPPIERLISYSVDVMSCLVQATLQSCHMGVLEDGKVAILAQVKSPNSLGVVVKAGSTLDIMESAMGYVILAFLESVRRECAIATWARETGRNAPKDLRTRLIRIREAGYEERASRLVENVSDISFPILDDRGNSVGALTIPYINYSVTSIDRKRVIQLLCNAAVEITWAIGGHTGLASPLHSRKERGVCLD